MVVMVDVNSYIRNIPLKMSILFMQNLSYYIGSKFQLSTIMQLYLSGSGFDSLIVSFCADFIQFCCIVWRDISWFYDLVTLLPVSFLFALYWCCVIPFMSNLNCCVLKFNSKVRGEFKLELNGKSILIKVKAPVCAPSWKDFITLHQPASWQKIPNKCSQFSIQISKNK